MHYNLQRRAVWPDWAIFEVFGDKLYPKSSQNVQGLS